MSFMEPSEYRGFDIIKYGLEPDEENLFRVYKDGVSLLGGPSMVIEGYWEAREYVDRYIHKTKLLKLCRAGFTKTQGEAILEILGERDT